MHVILWFLLLGTWSKCGVKGNGPPPCSGFSFHAFKEDKAILFGGRSEKAILNDIYFLNLEEWVSKTVKRKFFIK